MNVVIIRFEGSSAVCRKDTNVIIRIERGLLPLHTEEGDVLKVFGRRITTNYLETRKRRTRISELLNDILS
jgi:hypothetical protein